MIVSGSTSQALSAAIAAETDESLAVAEYDRFPDGELLASIPGFDGDRAVVVCATTSSDAHLELLQLQDAAREAGATEVVTVVPYMGYSRQDSAFKRGQPVSARAVARAIGSGTDRVVLVTPHEESVADFFDVPCETVDASSLLADPLPENLENPLFLGPDESAQELAECVRDVYGAGDTDYFEKTRDYDTGEVSVEPSDASVVDRDVVVVDDIIATGSTMSEAVGSLADRGANDVFATCVHPVLTGNARTKLAAAGIEAVYGTDTVERDVSAVSAASVVADAL
ncbi:ribose-phosphate diphosphokinase [Haloprofundus salinisoli]|uniref:ribose-phosphate diphosphokinase n=1 Tax=Haloprofundus salinisoli TaxID=2876193 RepID=UPI001CCBA465|nr:ribose-phosphate diphosphokinase [Haloprofundus salinisoli]